MAAGLRSLGVEEGDRVVACLPNVAEATAAFLAAVSIGAVWSSASPDFGAGSLIDRFGYRYGGKDFDRRPVAAPLAPAARPGRRRSSRAGGGSAGRSAGGQGVGDRLRRAPVGAQVTDEFGDVFYGQDPIPTVAEAGERSLWRWKRCAS